jgi:acyl carrier protein
MEDLEREIKVLIVESLKLEGVTPESIEATAPLFGDGLGLDSIDALELAMALRKRFAVKFEASNAANRETFGSVRNLAAYVTRSRQTPGTT